jgi:hypothetical protein
MFEDDRSPASSRFRPDRASRLPPGPTPRADAERCVPGARHPRRVSVANPKCGTRAKSG